MFLDVVPYVSSICPNSPANVLKHKLAMVYKEFMEL